MAAGRVRRFGANTALLILACATAGLAYVAITGQDAGTGVAVNDADPLAATSEPATSEPTTSEPATAEPTISRSAPSQPDRVARPPRAVAVDLVSSDVAWRAGAQACDGTEPGVLEVTVDGAASWAVVDLPLREVLDIDADSADAVTLHGLDASCVFTSTRTADGGRTWTPVRDAGSGTWTHSARDAMRAAGVPVEPPCEGVRDVARAGRAGAVVLCEQGVLMRSTDAAGSTFTTAGLAPNTVAVATTNGRLLFAAVADPACDGVQVARSDDGGATWTPGPCLAGTDATAPIGLALAERDVLLVTGDRSYLAVDGAWDTIAGA